MGLVKPSWSAAGSARARPAASSRASGNRYLATEELQHGVAVDAVVEVAAVPATRVDGQPLAEGAAQEAQVARAEDQVVGVVHDRHLGAFLQVVLEGVQADLVDQLRQAAAVVL